MAQCFLHGNLPWGNFLQNSFTIDGDKIKLLKCGCDNGVHLDCGIDGKMNDPRYYVKCARPGKPCKLWSGQMPRGIVHYLYCV